MQGQRVVKPFTVSPSLDYLAVQSSWNEGLVQLTLVAPSGRVMNSFIKDPNVTHNGGAVSETYVVRNPDPGGWTFELYGANVSAAGADVSVGVIETPLSDFGPIATLVASPDRGVAPLSIHFEGNASAFQGATITSYRWDFGDCSPADNSPNPTHVFATPGTFAVALTATDSSGQTDTVDHEILVTAYKHAPTADFVWDVLDLTKPNMVFFDGSESKDIDGQITKYSWDLGDGSVADGRGVVHNYAKAGTYTVRLTVTDDGGLIASNCQLVKTGVPAGAPTPCP
jgi:PKD repeat protein